MILNTWEIPSDQAHNPSHVEKVFAVRVLILKWNKKIMQIESPDKFPALRKTIKTIKFAFYVIPLKFTKVDGFQLQVQIMHCTIKISSATSWEILLLSLECCHHLIWFGKW